MRFRMALVGLLVSLFFAATGAAAAHPLDEFYQVTFITVGPNHVSFIVELYTGVLIAPQVLAMIDTNANDQISDSESRAYVDRFLGDLTFQVDEKAVPLRVDSYKFASPLDLRAGVGVIRMFLHADLPDSTPGPHRLFYANNHSLKRSVYVVNAISENPAWVQISQQMRDVFQKTIHLDFTVLQAAPAQSKPQPPAPAANIALPAGAPTEGQKWLTGYLYQTHLSPLVMGLVLTVAVVLGGLHALTPGHGKTLVAAYLIGSRGTVGHAVTLGGIVTFTHTASVIAIGLLALLASQFFVTGPLVPLLEILSGLLVVWIGGQLIWSRWQAYRRGKAGHHHHHHAHDHSHDHDDDDDDHHHHHDVPERVTVRDLLALGISGGLVPCPEALGIMLVAIGLNRISLGLGIVVAFSFGLAAVLIIIGVLLVRARSLLDNVTGVGQRWQAVLPLVSAVIVTLLGLGIMLKGLWPYLMG